MDRRDVCRATRQVPGRRSGSLRSAGVEPVSRIRHRDTSCEGLHVSPVVPVNDAMQGNDRLPIGRVGTRQNKRQARRPRLVPDAQGIALDPGELRILARPLVSPLVKLVLPRIGIAGPALNESHWRHNHLRHRHLWPGRIDSKQASKSMVLHGSSLQLIEYSPRLLMIIKLIVLLMYWQQELP